MNQTRIFLTRILLGIIFSSSISYFFFNTFDINKIAILVAIIVGLAYFSEFLRNKKR